MHIALGLISRAEQNRLAISAPGRLKQEDQDGSQLHNGFGTSLPYMRPCLTHTQKGEFYFVILILVRKMRHGDRVYLFLFGHMEKIRCRDSGEVRLSIRKAQ